MQDRTELKGAGIRVALGRQELARTTATRRIVFVPVDGPYMPPDRERERHTAAPVLATVDQAMVARIWGASIDDAWDIQQRLFQALNEYVAAGGYRFRHEGHQWDTDPDTSEQGEALQVRFHLMLPIDRAAGTSTTVATVNATTAIVSPITGGTTAGPTIDVP